MGGAKTAVMVTAGAVTAVGGGHRGDCASVCGGIGGTVSTVEQTTINLKAAAIVVETVVMVVAAHVRMVAVVVAEADAVAQRWQQKQSWWVKT